MFLDDANSQRAVEFFSQTSINIALSDWTAVEVSSVITKHCRMSLISVEEKTNLLNAFDLWRKNACTSVQIQSIDILVADQFIRQSSAALRGPDALHLAIARRLKVGILTFDKQMASAAQEFGIEVLGS
jgi:uncharacterized protein